VVVLSGCPHGEARMKFVDLLSVSLSRIKFDDLFEIGVQVRFPVSTYQI
jgi:hypothetical protein